MRIYGRVSQKTAEDVALGQGIIGLFLLSLIAPFILGIASGIIFGEKIGFIVVAVSFKILAVIVLIGFIKLVWNLIRSFLR